MQTIRSFGETCFVKIFLKSKKSEFFRWLGVGIIVAILTWSPFVLLHY